MLRVECRVCDATGKDKEGKQCWNCKGEGFVWFKDEFRHLKG